MNDPELDDLLNGALHRYCMPEPRPGMESRVLNRVHSSGRRRAVWQWVLAPAMACAAAAIAALWPATSIPEPPRLAAVQLAAPELQVAIPFAVPKRPVPHAAVFQLAPSPRMTAEERALAELAARGPEALRKSFDRTNEQSPEPIQIAAIEIKPLETKEP